MTDVLKHRFVSPKLDGADATQVQPSAWNDGHRFQGGVDGDQLVRATADATFGATWIAPGAYTMVKSTAAGTLADWNPGIVGNTIIHMAPPSNADITGFKPARVWFGLRLTLFLQTAGPVTLYPFHATSSHGYRLMARGGGGAIVITGSGWSFMEFQHVSVDGLGYWLLLGYGA